MFAFIVALTSTIWISGPSSDRIKQVQHQQVNANHFRSIVHEKLFLPVHEKWNTPSPCARGKTPHIRVCIRHKIYSSMCLKLNPVLSRAWEKYLLVLWRRVSCAFAAMPCSPRRRGRRLYSPWRISPDTLISTCTCRCAYIVYKQSVKTTIRYKSIQTQIHTITWTENIAVQMRKICLLSYFCSYEKDLHDF